MQSLSDNSYGRAAELAAYDAAKYRIHQPNDNGIVERPHHPRQFVAAPSWKATLLAAKAAYKNGHPELGIQLYKAGLESAQSALPNRSKLIEFLRQNIWS